MKRNPDAITAPQVFINFFCCFVTTVAFLENFLNLSLPCSDFIDQLIYSKQRQFTAIEIFVVFAKLWRLSCILLISAFVQINL